MTTNRIADLLIQALQNGNADAFERLAGVLSPDVDFASSQVSPSSGPREVASQLQRLQAAGRFSRTLEWDELQDGNGEIKVRAAQPVSSQYSSYVWDLALDAQGKVQTIRQTGLAQTEPLPASPIVLDDDIDRALKHAHETTNPMIVAYVNGKGQPIQSPRGTVQILSQTQLAMWIWSRTGGLIGAIEVNPDISIHYWGGIGTAYGGALLFQGLAHMDDTQATRDIVYENSPPSEQRQDPDRAGRALVVDLYRVSGFVGGFRYNMAAELD